jgi:hypothetical protein
MNPVKSDFIIHPESAPFRSIQIIKIKGIQTGTKGREDERRASKHPGVQICEVDTGRDTNCFIVNERLATPSPSMCPYLPLLSCQLVEPQSKRKRRRLYPTSRNQLDSLFSVSLPRLQHRPLALVNVLE